MATVGTKQDIFKKAIPVLKKNHTKEGRGP